MWVLEFKNKGCCGNSFSYYAKPEIIKAQMELAEKTMNITNIAK
ncbi:hypothetical protein MGA3_07270 [Bacillus methanolicus MGA3]|nr:hypothetical protein MGA3_07270 [Bacillus methanolicus MGA3]